MLCCGLRRGEAIALKADDIDLVARTITVRRSMSMSGGKWTLKIPKSKAGLRRVPIPSVIIPMFGEPGDGFLLTRENGSPITAQACHWWWKSFMRVCHIEAGAALKRNAIVSSPVSFDLTPHYLRHTYATDLYAIGLDEKSRKYILGHSSSDVTDRYTKMSDEAFGRAAAAIDAYFSAKWGKYGANEKQQ
ncbi:MAG: site-specific integrase [Oscillospiraceae bacterium]|jgi:integrase|nr:site-specific integrase [Oscillospiraceae bacterium]